MICNILSKAPHPNPPRSRGGKKIAFTLAEVLITLGIIGVVAAMTIPALMTKYHRSVAENKLKKFHSTMNQALRMSMADDETVIDIFPSDTPENQQAAELTKWYQNNILNYMSGADIKIANYGKYVKVTLKDGSGFYSYSPSGTFAYIFYCLDAAHPSCGAEHFDGRNTFLFSLSSNGGAKPYCAGENISRCKLRCYDKSQGTHCCAELIKKNGWKIPDDYPWIK